MSNVDYAQQLDEQLHHLETSTGNYDAGTVDDAIRIATSLRLIFHQTGQIPSLLAQLQARLTKVMTSVEKPPYPQDWYFPMADIEGRFHYKEIVVGASPLQQSMNVNEPTRYRPMLDRKKLLRQIQATEWWGHEPVFIGQGKKTTRKDIALWACRKNGDGDNNDDETTSADKPYRAQSARTAINRDLIGPDMKVKDAYCAALWQMAHEVLKSPDLIMIARK